MIAEAMRVHTLEGSEKFVQEVFWRTYFKGWLERRPSVWTAYKNEIAAQSKQFPNMRAVRSAQSGETGIACFDAWAHELVETNYLHNHARMWFASIWIFTLRLPWVLGADFFLRHLLDGDPASNTLSWRWVAGLHTRGKNYAAAPWNIAKFTNGRFTPAGQDLAEDPEPLTESFAYGEALPLRTPSLPDPARPTGLLITLEDCLPETLGLTAQEVQNAATLQISPPNADDAVTEFDTAALSDAAARAKSAGLPHAEPLNADDPASLVNWATGSGVTQIATAYVPIGPTRDWLDRAAPALTDAGIALTEVRRDWDAAVWPLATAGFFKVKKQIPRLISELYP